MYWKNFMFSTLWYRAVKKKTDNSQSLFNSNLWADFDEWKKKEILLRWTNRIRVGLQLFWKLQALLIMV